MSNHSSEPPFINTQPPEGRIPKNFNVSETTPIRDFGLLVCGVSLGLVILYWSFGFIGEFVAVHIPPQWEQRFFQSSQPLSKFQLAQIPTSRETRVEQIFAKLTPIFHKENPNPISLKVAIYEEPQLNAFAFPGGWILVSRGLNEKIKSEVGLAFVLGHELGHFFHRDHLRGLGRGLGMALLGSLLGFSDSTLFAPQIIESLVAKTHSREQESRADSFALKLVTQVYSDLTGADEFFQIVLRESGSISKHLPTALSTHPNPEQRRDEVQRFIREKK